MKSLEEIKASGKVWDVMSMAQLMPDPRTLTPGMMCGNIHLKDCGTCSVVWSDRENGFEHVSISPKKKFKLPTWDDMCELKDVFWHDDEEAYQIMPKKSEYVNIQKNCLHLWKPVGHIIGELATLANREAKPR